MERARNKPSNSKRSPPKHAETILATLRNLGRPASAYDLQAQLASTGHLAPPTIYRALDRLVEDGSVHKVESLNAYVACSHGCHRGPSILAICERCGCVSEFNEPGIECAVDGWARNLGFSVRTTALELHGLCANCSSGASP